jgi:pyruvate dehydrogenase E1 component alpha subunit
MDKGERAAAIAADPVAKLRARLIADHLASDTELAKIESAIESDLDEAVEYALASAFPEIIELKRDVFAQELV